MNELMRQLDLISLLSMAKGCSAEDLSTQLGVSVPTVKRDVAACRHLGADIISDRMHGYRLMNWLSIRRTVRRWRALERARDGRIERGLKARAV